jgi:enoyl-CoA hydratase
VATVTLNRADKANAMDATMWQELEACFTWLDAEPSVRVVILAAQGKHFCSGIDLSLFAEVAQMEAGDQARKAELLRRKILSLQANLTAIERCRKPVLAAIHSSCIGGGVDMISCCDMRYCSEQASFSIKEIDLAMTADVGTLQRLPRIIGDGMVRELAYTGRDVDAEEACQLGLVNRVYRDREQLLAEVTSIARQIAAKSPLAVRGTKEMLLYTRDHSVADGLNYIATWNAGMLSADDVMKAVAANMQGEQAHFDD